MVTSITDKMNSTKVAIYIRVSTHWQIDKDSLQVQRRELIAYSEMVLGIRDYTVFEDPGYSAKNTDRPDYQKMMERLRTGEFTHLLVWKIDRISRNLLDFASMYQELKELGITFVSKNEQFDTSSAIGEAMLKIILVFAELERNMTSERVTAVMLSRAANGQWNGGRVPFGYDYDKETKKFSISKSESAAVRLMYDLYEEYHSIKFVCDSINGEGIKTKTGSEWSPTTIHKVLTSPFYIGVYRYNVYKDGKGIQKRDKSEWIDVPEHHEPIISDIQFDRVQFILKRNIRGGFQRGESHVKNNIHIFSGIVKCGICGCNMSATLDRRRANGVRPSVYGCSQRRKDSSKCSNKFVNDVIIGQFIFNYIANIIRAKEKVTKKTTVSELQKKLLYGEVFEKIESVNEEALEALLTIMKSGTTGLEYKPRILEQESDTDFDEVQLLKDRRRRKEIALNRLHSLYLYGDDETPEKDYIIERKKITSEIEEIDEQLKKMTRADVQNIMPTDDTIEKASYFIMVEKLLGTSYINYETYIKGIEPSVPKNFLNSIIESIEVTNSKVTAITFKNGIRHKFNYMA